MTKRIENLKKILKYMLVGSQLFTCHSIFCMESREEELNGKALEAIRIHNEKIQTQPEDSPYVLDLERELNERFKLQEAKYNLLFNSSFEELEEPENKSLLNDLKWDMSKWDDSQWDAHTSEYWKEVGRLQSDYKSFNKRYRSSDTVYNSLSDPEQKSYTALSIDGGGIRGIIPAIFLSYLENDYLRPGKLCDVFDYVAGTSIGGIIALGIASKIPASDFVELFENKGHVIFQKAGYSRGWLSAAYNHEPLESLLKDKFQEKTLADVSTNILVTACTTGGTPVLFENREHSRTCKLWEVARCTSAAPTYFPAGKINFLQNEDTGVPEDKKTFVPPYIPEWKYIDGNLEKVDSYSTEMFSPCIHPFNQPQPAGKKEGYTLVDGGLWANNPSLLLLSNIMRYERIKHDQIHMLSLGTGLAPNSSELPLNAGKTKVGTIIEVMMSSNSIGTDYTLSSLYLNEFDQAVNKQYFIKYNREKRQYSKRNLIRNYWRINPYMLEPIDLADITQIEKLQELAKSQDNLNAIDEYYDQILRPKLESKV